MNNTNKLIRILLVGLFIGGLYGTSFYSYLLFHSLAEAFTVIVTSSIFILAWNTRHWMEDDYFLFLGVAFLFVSIIDLLHTLAFRGMGIFKGFDANLPTQLWILARYIQSLSLLVAPVWLKKRLPVWPAILSYFGISAGSLGLIFSGKFPACYIEGVGLTDFKIISEYVIILFLAGSIVPLLRNKRKFEPGVLHTIIAFLTVSVGAELAFTTYLGVYDAANLIGHLLRLVSYSFLYGALLRTGLQQPFDLVFRDLKLKETALLRSEANLQRLFDINPFPVVVTTQSDSRFLKVNRAAMEIFELTPADLSYYKGLDFYANPADRLRVFEILHTQGRIQHELLELKTKSGKSLWCLVNGVFIEMDGVPALFTGMVDITEQRRIQEELRYLSTHDALTGVYNRTYFEAEMNRLQKGRRFPVSIIMLDMDELKQINDTYGHVQGDQCLRMVASLVKEILRAEEVFARIGGDEFAILLPNAETSAASLVRSRIKSRLEQYTDENGNIALRVSIGIGLANEKEDLNEALKRADADMYTDKNIRKRITKPLKAE